MFSIQQRVAQLVTILLLTYTYLATSNGSYGTVSLEGYGNYATIFEALEAAPSNSSCPVYITLQAKEYHEQVLVQNDKTNIVMTGQGIEKTFIIHNGSSLTNQTTMSSATFGKYILILNYLATCMY